jgi:hypothetical protein
MAERFSDGFDGYWKGSIKIDPNAPVSVGWEIPVPTPSFWSRVREVFAPRRPPHLLTVHLDFRPDEPGGAGHWHSADAIIEVPGEIGGIKVVVRSWEDGRLAFEIPHVTYTRGELDG